LPEGHKAVISRLLTQRAFPEDTFFIDKVFRDRKIIVYGAGESFHYFKEIIMRRYGYTASVILDRKFRRGNSFEDIAALSPFEYQPTRDEQENGLVVVCLGNQTYLEEVTDTLRGLGFSNIISLMDIYEIHNPFRLPAELEEKGFRFYLEQKERIESCLDLFADDLSREIFVKCMQTHLQRKPVAIPMSSRDEQYTPKGVQLARGYSRFIYCGVSVGEMTRIFSQVGKVDELVCFEPDPNQFRQTVQYLSNNHEQLARHVTAFPCAVYSHEAIKPFTYSDTSFGSRILESAKDSIQCVSIDNVLPGFKPTFVCMDIEGAELEALKGAEKTIRAGRPDLGVCVYHSPDHLWEVPLYLHSLGTGYRFYLRNYTGFIGETVLYAAT